MDEVRADIIQSEVPKIVLPEPPAPVFPENTFDPKVVVDPAYRFFKAPEGAIWVAYNVTFGTQGAVTATFNFTDVSPFQVGIFYVSINAFNGDASAFQFQILSGFAEDAESMYYLEYSQTWTVTTKSKIVIKDFGSILRVKATVTAGTGSVDWNLSAIFKR